MLIIASSWNILSLGFYCWVTCHSPQSAFLCSPLNVCAWGSVFLYVIPGVISSTSLSLATFGQGLIISFPDYFHSLLISCFWPFLFHCSYLAKTKMYDHITPLLRIFGRVSFVLRIESRLLALASRSLCCVTVCLFRFTALFFFPILPFFWASDVLSYLWFRKCVRLFMQCLWTGFLHTVSEVSLPMLLFFNCHLQLLQKLKIQLHIIWRVFTWSYRTIFYASLLL